MHISPQAFGVFILDVFLFSVLSIALAFLVDLLIPNPGPLEPLWKTIILIGVQLMLSMFILYGIDKLYSITFNRDSDAFFGMTLFSVIFFLTQMQLYNRLQRIYFKITKRTFK